MPPVIPYYARPPVIKSKHSALPVGLIDKSGIRGNRVQTRFYGQISLSYREHRCSLQNCYSYYKTLKFYKRYYHPFVNNNKNR